MKKIYYVLILTFFSWSITFAQQYIPLEITSGFNEDVIAENSPAATFTTTAVDATGSGANNAFMSINYPGATVGLPSNGLITSIANSTTGLTFQLAPFNQNNALRINANGGSGTLILENTNEFRRIFILATSGSDLSNFTGIITFTDGSTQVINTQSVPDWYQNGLPAVTIQGIGRVGRNGGNPDNNTTNPKIFQVAININPVNQNKIINQIDVTKTSSNNGYLNIFGVSGEVTPDCIEPEELNADVLSLNSAKLNWTGLGNNFDIKWDLSGFDVTTEGNLISNFENDEILTGLIANTNYQFYVRQNCGSEIGFSQWSGPFNFFTGYCIPTGSQNNSDEIRNFTLSNLNNTSSASEGTSGYMNYSETVDPAILDSGVAYTASLTSGSGTLNHGAAIWIDYNNNLIFEEDEKVTLINNNIQPNSTVNFPAFTVPEAIEPGIYRLRVQYMYNLSGSMLTPCSTLSEYAETEDYSIQILPLITCDQPSNIEINSATKNSASLSWSIPTTETPVNLGYKIEIRTSGEPGDTSGLINTITTTNLSSELSDLEPETTYFVFIQSLCTETNQSLWSEISFTTSCNYPEVELVNSNEELNLCNTNSITLEADSDGLVRWYTSENEIIPIHIGNSYTTESLNESTSFWYEAISSSTTVTGPTDPSIIGDELGDWTTSSDVYFTVNSTTTLESIDIYPITNNQSGTIIFKLDDEIIETINYTTTSSGGENAQTISLNLSLEPGNYIIETILPTDGLKNNIADANYPYSTTIASITGNEFSDDYYMGYYNWIFSSACVSPRETVTVVINNTLAPSANNQQFCIGENATISDLIANGTSIKWYSNILDSDELDSTTLLASGTYYASQTIDSCESVERTPVLITIQNTPTPTAINQQFCAFQNANVENLVANGTSIKWYSTPSNGTPLNPSSALISGTYYASQTINGCESALRASIEVNVLTSPEMPEAASIQTFCGNATLADMIVTNQNNGEIIWYSSSISDTELPLSTTLTNSTYYVAVKIGTCTSQRKAIAARVISTIAPTISPFVFCESATVADLTIIAQSGITHKWYTSPTNSNSLTLNTSLNSGVYYVSRVQNGCESARAAVQVTIESLPNSPTGNETQTFVEGSTINHLIVQPASAVWYSTIDDAKTGTNQLSPGMPLVQGETYYAVNIGTNGCPSLPLAVTVNLTLDNEDFIKKGLKLYPNPVSDYLTIEYSEAIDQIVIYNILGQSLYSKKYNESVIQVDFNNFDSGTYMIKVFTKRGEAFLKIIKQ